MSFSLLGLGTAVPGTVIDQATAADIAVSLCCRTPEQRTWLPVMYQQSGIRSRHLQFDPQVVRDIVSGSRESGSPFLPTGRDDDAGPTTNERMVVYRERAGALSAQAARAALERAGVAARRITHLITVSCTGFHAPGFDCELIDLLGLPRTVARTHVGFMGCHGALNGLRVANAFATADPSARVLVCATELCSLHYHYGWNPQKMVANALFGDGSAAIVGAATGGWGRLVASGSCLLPDSVEAMSWAVGDRGFEMTLSKQVPALISRHLRPWLIEWLGAQGTAIADIAHWAVHPGGPKILDAVGESLNLLPAALAPSRAVLAEYGNMSSPTVLFILDRLREQQARGPCVVLGFGPGMTAEAALIRIAFG